MYLSDIATQPEMHMVLVQSDCVRLIQFMQDKIKRKFKINRDSEIIVNSYKDLYQIKEVQGVIPPLSDKWYVVLDLDKLDSGAVEKAIKTGDTCIFFCMCTKYTTYKKYKELSDAEFYMSYLKKRDIVYLYDALVSEENKLNKQIFS